MSEALLNQPELVGRDAELVKLKEALDAAIIGKGSTTFIAGEAGIGKTRLVSELISKAEKKGAQIIHGWCLAESLEPLMPVKSALREAGLFHLISGDPPPMVVSAYLMNDAGLLIAKAEREELGLDPYIFGSMLKAVGSFVKDSMQMVDNVERTGGLNTLGYQDYKILIEESDGLYLAAVTKGSLSEMLVGDMRNVLTSINSNFKSALNGWDGDLEKLSGIDAPVSRLVMSGKYSGKHMVDDPELRRENLFDNVLMGLRRLSADKPLLLFLDDLQWADPTTLTLLHYLAKNLTGEKAMILGTYRPEDILRSWDGKTHPLETAMQNMNREGLLEKIEIKRLDSINSRAIVLSVLGTRDFDNTVMDRIYKEADGNPFFVLEVLKLLTEEGAIAQAENGAWKLAADVEKLDIPSKVYDVVKRRLDRLMEEQRRILDCASVVGDEFRSDVVGKVVNIGKMQLLENLSKIEKTHNLVHYLKDKYRFDHAKVRDVLYNGIGEELRREYHRVVGDTIAELHKDNVDEVAGELAYHYYEAKDEKATEYLIKMGENANKESSVDEATRAYTQAVEITKRPCLKIEGLLGLISTDIYYGNYRLAEVKITEVKKYIKECQDKKLEAKAILASGLVSRLLGDNKSAQIMLDKSLQMYKELNDKDGISNAFLHTAAKAYSEGNYNVSLDLLKQCLQIQIEQGNDQKIPAIYRRLGTISTSIGDYTRALDYLEKGRKIAVSIGEKRMITAILYDMAEIAEIQGNYEEGINLLEMELKIWNEIAKEYDLYRIYHTKAKIAHLKNDFNQAIELYNKCAQLCSDKEDKMAPSFFYRKISEIYLDLGNDNKALEYAERNLKISAVNDDKYNVISGYQLIASIQLMNKEYQKALYNCEQSLQIAKSINASRRIILDYCRISQIFLETQDFENALEHVKSGLSIAMKINAKLEEGICHRVLGMVYRERGEIEKALEEFETVTTMFNIMKMKKELACVQYERALLFKKQGKVDEAKECLEKAYSEFERMGMKYWADKCRKALEDLDT